MHSSPLLLLTSAASLAAAQETVYGVYIFSRHGDRTPKALPPTNLTQLGYQQIYQRGAYYRSQYISSGAPKKIPGINTDIVKLSQLSVSAPVDNVLQSSASGFLQGLYPPYSNSETLRNGSSVQAPLGGYQIIPVQVVSQGSGAEENAWLQDASGCNNAKISSNNYFLSKEYAALASGTQAFWSRLVPVVNATFDASYVTYKNAYSVYDLINVAEIHNATIPSQDVLDNSTLLQLRSLANAHEFGLAYNASDNARAISGMQLAAEVVAYLNGTITGGGKQKLGIQFGAYATFLSFFGLANLTAANGDFYGINDYASSMIFELFATGTSSAVPSQDNLQVRFSFHNGSSAAGPDPTVYPLFGGSSAAIPWTSFVSGMKKFSVGTTEQWCKMCGNTTGSCQPYAASIAGNSSATSTGSSSAPSSDGGISRAVAGVIGAMVTLGVILGLEALILLIGGFRLVSKKRMQGKGSPMGSTSEATKA